MEKWYRKEYVCPDCDALIQISTKSATLRDKNCLECNGNLTLMNAKPEPTINDIKRQIEENEECGGCGFYTSDPDSQPLENCETCGRESV